MKVLYLCNVLTSEIAKEINEEAPIFGGWIEHSIENLRKKFGIDVFMCLPHLGEDKRGIAGDIRYFVFRQGEETVYDVELTKSFEKIITEFDPDVIHIWGTEYPHTLSMINAAEVCGMLDMCVISIQGILGPYLQAYNAELPYRVRSRFASVHDLLRKSDVNTGKKSFAIRSTFEKTVLSKVKNVIGRTQWDKEEVFKLNPDSNYYFCNETLREKFYRHIGQWRYDKCQKHSVFLSQASYPIKGAHKLFEILPLLKKKYGDIKVYIGCNDFVTFGDTVRGKLRLSGYKKYMRRLIVKNDLRENIVFLGASNEDGMIKNYLNANVFLSPSSIENSSNSIGEAMLIGVPVVCSNVGGNPSMCKNGVSALFYDFGDSKEMYDSICKIFDSSDLAEKLGRAASSEASLRHSPEINSDAMYNIYQRITNIDGAKYD